MKLALEKEKICLFPENSYDHFMLGTISAKIPHEIVITKDTDNPENTVQVLKISHADTVKALMKSA